MAKGTANRPFGLLSQAAILSTIVADSSIKVIYLVNGKPVYRLLKNSAKKI